MVLVKVKIHPPVRAAPEAWAAIQEDLRKSAIPARINCKFARMVRLQLIEFVWQPANGAIGIPTVSEIPEDPVARVAVVKMVANLALEEIPSAVQAEMPA